MKERYPEAEAQYLGNLIVSSYRGSTFHKPLESRKSSWGNYQSTPCGTLAGTYAKKASDHKAKTHIFRACSKCFTIDEANAAIQEALIAQRAIKNRTSPFLVYSAELETAKVIEARNADEAVELFADQVDVQGVVQVVPFLENRKVARRALVVTKI